MELDELEATAQKGPSKEEHKMDDDQIIIDLNDAMVLLGRCMHLLDYVSDTDLCRSITKRERETFDRLSVSIREYLDEVQPTYEEGGE